jgi:hypothetical protein
MTRRRTNGDGAVYQTKDGRWRAAVDLGWKDGARQRKYRAMAGHLMWTRGGTVWATWRLRPLPYGYRPVKDKHDARGVHQALFRALPGESLLLGVCAGLDSAAVVERMIEGIPLEDCPDWAAECEATLDTLDEIGPGQRVFWLCVPLRNSTAGDRLFEPWRAAAADLRDTLALPRVGVPAADLTRRLEQARKVGESIPAPFAATPATPAQLAWLYLHAQQRGLALDMDLPDPIGDRDLTGQLLTPRSGSALPEPLLDEGGQSDLDRKALKNLNPMSRRYLKVGQPAVPGRAPQASYQALLVLADVPSGGMVFPGSEFIGRVDESGLDVDWAMRLQVRAGEEVASRNRRALVNLNEQFGQREGEMSHGLNQLDRAAADLAEYAAIMSSEKLEVEVQVTTIFCVSAATADGAGDQAAAFAQHLGQAGYKLTQPVGYQEDLWWSMIPGAATNRAVREFAQITTSRALAAAVPLASAALGDRTGSLLGLNISTGRADVVLHDIAGATERDTSGSIAIVGELGAGKALDVFCPIPTPTGWTTMGELKPGDQVLDEQGQPTVVLGTSAVMTGHCCYEVEFSDGSVITADAEHLWTTVPDRVRVGQAKRNYKVRARGGQDLIDLTEHTSALTGAGWLEHAETVTTEQMRQTLHARGLDAQANHAIPTAAPLQLPPASLPLDPYLLGVWLGDGTCGTSQVTSADPEILTMVADAGHHVVKLVDPLQWSVHRFPAQSQAQQLQVACLNCGKRVLRTFVSRRYCNRSCVDAAARHGVVREPAGCDFCTGPIGRSNKTGRCSTCWHGASVTGTLRLLGVLRNKHVPPVYLRGSVAQRQALLAGLLDTDGTVSPHGAVQFDNTNRQLAVDVHELACSLGYRAALREGRARLYGRDYGPKWTVSFTTTDPVFRLPRKQQAQAERTVRSSPARNRFRYVVDVREVSSVPVRCIRVASSSQLFLAGRSMIPTHNSLTLKSLAGDVVDRGGRVVTIDRTQMGEYARWANSITRATVVDISAPQVSLDPLRLFSPEIGSRVTQTFLTPLLNIAPTSERGVLLSDVLDPAYLGEQAITSLGGLLEHLAEGCRVPGAGELARVMNVFARRDFGRVVFDQTLPVLHADVPAVVIRTHTLQLPSREELAHKHLFDQMGLEKLFGRAMYALIAALARRICFDDPSRLGVFLVDEAHHVTASPEGELEIAVFSRDGRKHKAAVLLGTHDPEEDLGSPTLRGLIPTRILMRHRDKTLARRGLAYLGLDPHDDELVQLLTEDTSPVTAHGVQEHRRGEAFMRDAIGNIGRIKVLLPAVPARATAVLTSPQEAKFRGLKKA